MGSTSHRHLQPVQGEIGSASVTAAHDASVITGTLADFSAAKESMFADSRERWMCFQACLWCSIVRLMSGADMSSKKEKNGRVGVLLQSKDHIHQPHAYTRAQDKAHSYSYPLGLNIDPGASYWIEIVIQI